MSPLLYDRSIKQEGAINLITCGLAGKQGCQMVSFQTKNPNLGKFWRALE
jgi:hypothetical protein